MTPPPNATPIRALQLVASPWKNGGGVTREIAAQAPAPGGDSGAPDAFIWRVSVADVASAGPFSRFDGVDRTLVLLSGAGMLLDERTERGMRTHELTQPLDVARFAGEVPIEARLVDGPTRDFNLMVRREAARGTLDIWRDNASHNVAGDTVLLYCTSGESGVSIDGSAIITLAAGDTLRLDGLHETARGVRVETRGSGVLLAVALFLTRVDANRNHHGDAVLRSAAQQP